MSDPHLLVIIGSTRPGRVGKPVGDWFTRFASEHGGFEVEPVDLAEVNLPVFDEPKHPRLREYEHEHTKRWSAIVERADAYVFVVPEYNCGVNSATKNAIDYLNQEWAHKPAGFVSYGGAAGTRAVQMLRQIVSALRMTTLTDAVNVPFVTQFIDKQGVFVPSGELEDGATTMLNELVGVSGALQRLRQPSGAEVLQRFLDIGGKYLAAGGPDGGAHFDAFLPLLAEDAVMRQAKHLLYGGDWVGHDGFRDFFAQLSRTWSSLELRDIEIYEPAPGGDRVVV